MDLPQTTGVVLGATISKKTPEELIKEKDELILRRDKMIEEVEKTSIEITYKWEEIFESQPEKYVKVSCPTCGGRGFIINEDNDKKIVCQVCGGKLYIWMSRYETK